MSIALLLILIIYQIVIAAWDAVCDALSGDRFSGAGDHITFLV